MINNTTERICMNENLLIAKDIIRDVCENKLTKKRDRDYYYRMWNTSLESYFNRLIQLGFLDIGRVLDAGSGYGQWSYCLSLLGNNVLGLEYDLERVEACNYFLERINCHNMEFRKGSIEDMELDNESFDGVFSFAAIQCSNFKKSFREINRILKTNGLFFFNASDLGWFIYNIIEDHNPSEGFSSSQWAIDSIYSSINYFITDNFHKKDRENLLMPKEVIMSELKDIGFEIVQSGRQGSCALYGEANWNVDRPEKRYGVNDTYEVICRKIK